MGVSLDQTDPFQYPIQPGLCGIGYHPGAADIGACTAEVSFLGLLVAAATIAPKMSIPPRTANATPT
jgi:hypothetical protein